MCFGAIFGDAGIAYPETIRKPWLKDDPSMAGKHLVDAWDTAPKPVLRVEDGGVCIGNLCSAGEQFLGDIGTVLHYPLALFEQMDGLPRPTRPLAEEPSPYTEPHELSRNQDPKPVG